MNAECVQLKWIYWMKMRKIIEPVRIVLLEVVWFHCFDQNHFSAIFQIQRLP